jgi:hypothetical protein
MIGTVIRLPTLHKKPESNPAGTNIIVCGIASDIHPTHKMPELIKNEKASPSPVGYFFVTTKLLPKNNTATLTPMYPSAVGDVVFPML